MGLWHFDEGSGTMAADSSGNHNDGTLMRFMDPSAAWVPGKFGNALAIDASGYVLVQATPSIDPGIDRQVSLSAWVYYTGTIAETEYGTAISRQINAATLIDQYYHLALHNPEGVPNLYVSPSEAMAGMSVAGTKAVRRYTWVHLAGTYDGSSATLFVNGDPVMSRADSGRFTSDTTPVILGGNANMSITNVTELFPGLIDEITLYNRALSADEVKQLAQAPVF